MPGSKKETPSKKSPSIAIEGNIPKLTLDMPLDAKKIQQIQRCIANGKLTITVSRVDLSAGRIGEAWIYD
jgi:hypothetical protein